jgi:tripartite-type tricarboxylate transporter receptor subunit TctC
MNTKSKSALAVVAAGLSAAALTSPALAQDAAARFPEKPITLILPWPAGGSSDIVARALAEVVRKRLGQPVVVDNRAGASGTLGPATMAATAKPDGYTICHIPLSVFRFPSMQKTTYDPVKDFTYIIQLSGFALATAVLAEGPFKTWQDVITFARANPGKLTYSTPGVAGQPHLGMEMMAAREGVKFTHVPMKGVGDGQAAVLGGHVQLQAETTSFRPLVDAGKFRVLNVWGAQRLKIWPDVPTLQELGYPFVFDSPYGLAGPKGMDPAIVQKLHDAFKAALDDPSVQAVLAKFDKVSRYLNSADYTASVPKLIAQERAGLELVGLLKKD